LDGCVIQPTVGFNMGRKNKPNIPQAPGRHPTPGPTCSKQDNQPQLMGMTAPACAIQTQPTRTQRGEDLNLFHRVWGDFKASQATESDWRTIRTLWGFHVSRDGSYMLRLRFPGGKVTPHQIRELPDFLHRWSPDKPFHLTTRQNIQVYGLALADLPVILEDAEIRGLDSYQSGGAVVRTPTTCEETGSCPSDRIDPTPVLEAFQTWAVQKGGNLPRKVKIAISGCPNDCAAALAHDFGLTGLRDALGRKGFKVLAGGGLGKHPREAQVLEPFVLKEDAPAFLARAVETFRRLGQGRQRPKARLKYLLEEIGLAEFRAEMDKTPSVRLALGGPAPLNDHPGLEISIPWGWCTAQQWETLTDTLYAHDLGGLRLTAGQTVQVLGVPSLERRERAVVSYRRKGFRVHDQAPPFRQVSCPGAATCRGAATATDPTGHSALSKVSFPETGGNLHLSGCPNQCGRPLLASLGFSGEAVIQDGVRRERYAVWMGGGPSPNGFRFGKRVATIDAPQLPAAAQAVVQSYNGNSPSKDTFSDYTRKLADGPVAHVQAILEPFLVDESTGSAASVTVESDCA